MNNTNNIIHRSPLFYVGDKYKLMAEIKTYLPDKISTFIEPFVGGGSVFMNVEADNYILNDVNYDVISLHKFLCSYRINPDAFFNELFSLIDTYNLSCSYKRDDIPAELKKKYVKTYFAKYNKDAFYKLRDDYNLNHREDCLYLYTLLIYGFNRMIRFNSKGDYNLPVGNVDFNGNTYNALVDYFSIVKEKNIIWHNQDFVDLFKTINITKNDLVYLDPPYLITFSEYNKLWNETTEQKLLDLLDELDNKHIRFAISNVTHYKGKENTLFISWMQKYNVHSIKSNYISYHDNTVKSFNEVLVTNY